MTPFTRHAAMTALLALFALSCTACLVDESPESQATTDVSSEGHGDVGETFDPLKGYDAPNLEQRLRLLRQEHDFGDEGSPCSMDTDCGSPLRCTESDVCAFPPGLIGQADQSTPFVLIESGQSGEPMRYFVEIADTQTEQMRGLMNRQLMSENFGMLFEFQFEAPRSFWMRNTFIPLDMLFIDADGEIVSIIENAEPLTETSRRSEGPAKYVLELAGGETARAGIEPGDHVTIIVPES